MKAILSAVSNTVKAVKLLSDPRFSELLQKEMQGKPMSKEAFYHKHYVVQVMS
jgi:hypothetical protein